MNYDDTTLARRFGRVGHFRSMSIADHVRIVTAGRLRRFQSGATIYEEGQSCTGLYVLFSGRVNLHKLGLQGQEWIVDVIRPVIMFNEVAALDGERNPLTATAAADCITWHVSPERFTTLTKRYPVLGVSLLMVLARRNRMLILQLEDLLCRPVSARTAKVLLGVSHGGQRKINRHLYPNLELAARAVTGPEVFSRSLRTLRDAGVIDCNRREIMITSPQRLAELALVEGENGEY